MDDLAELTGRKREIMEYYGDKDAESIIVLMSSSSENAIEAINYMNAHEGKKWGLIKVLLYRPWS